MHKPVACLRLKQTCWDNLIQHNNCQTFRSRRDQIHRSVTVFMITQDRTRCTAESRPTDTGLSYFMKYIASGTSDG